MLFRDLDTYEIEKLKRYRLPDWQVEFIKRTRHLMDETQKTNKEIVADIKGKYKYDILESSLSNYIAINKKPTTPPIEAIITLAKYFGVTTHYLLGQTEAKTLDNEGISKAIGLNNGAIEKLRTLKYLSDHIPPNTYKDYTLQFYEDDFTIVDDPTEGKKYAVKGAPSDWNLQQEMQRPPDNYYATLNALVCTDGFLELVSMLLFDSEAPTNEERMLDTHYEITDSVDFLKRVRHVRDVSPTIDVTDDTLLAYYVAEALRKMKTDLKDASKVREMEDITRQTVPNYKRTISHKERARLDALKKTYKRDGLEREVYTPNLPGISDKYWEIIEEEDNGKEK